MKLKTLENNYQKISFADGVYLRDKSHKFDCLYFCAKFINEYSKNRYFDLEQNVTNIKVYLSNRFSIKINASLNNYYREPLELLEIAKVIKKQTNNKYKILNQEMLTFITERPENSYIFNYIISYYIINNSKCMNLYKSFCNSKTNVEKEKYLKQIHKKFIECNPFVKKADTNWRNQITKYIMENMNYINGQPHITRTHKIQNKKERKEMISINVEGTRSKGKKNNGYLKVFDDVYVKDYLNKLLIKGE